MKRVGKVVVLDTMPGAPSRAKDAPETTDYFAKLAPALETANINDLPVLDLPEAMQTRLMDHQKIGVRWLHSLYLNSSGGILGDDMGLGKTYQVICLLAGLMQQELIKRVLILAPVSVLPNWERELLEHLQPHVPGLDVFLTNSDLTKKKRLQILDSTFNNGARRYSPKIVISSYQLVSNMVEDFANRGRWDYVILDEGHVIKNPSTKTSKSMHLLSSNHRLILTGTPIQNNLNEFWALVNWATKGKRFGTLSGFKEDYTMPIVLGQDPKASPEQRRIAEEAAQNLLALTKPIILQRKKCELPSNDQLNLPTKIELVVWSPLASSQRELYEQFIHSRQFSTALNRSTCPVEVINHLKTVCRHPLLIEALEMNRKRRDQSTHPSQSAQSPRPARSQASKPQHRGEEDEMDFLSHGLADMSMHQDGTGEEEGELEEVLKSLPTNASVFDVVNRDPDVRELLRGSIKLRILLKLVHRLHFAGHRTLVFSQSRLMLDIIQRVFVEYGLASHRIDGSVRSSERQRIIDEYNDTSEGSIGPSICLLTTKACGFGITLTGADRVIIYDPSWNPAEDRQAVDRAYRIGQTKPVVVYRLIMASSVEEKMYEKQVFKDGIRVVTESGTSSRYFSKDETSELFTLGPVDQSVVMERLWTAAGENIREFPDTRGELPSVLGFTRHDTLYTEARPNASSQGQDAYSQYVDPDHVPSDDEDGMVGVPPTPAAAKTRPKTAPVSAVKRPAQTPGKENILAALNKMRELANDTAKKNKERDDDAFDLRSPVPEVPPRSTTVFDLRSPSPMKASSARMSGASAFSQISDLTCDSPMMSQEEADAQYEQLSASKLFQGNFSPASPVPEMQEASPARVGTPLCSDSDSDEEEGEEEKEGGESGGEDDQCGEEEVDHAYVKPEPDHQDDNYWGDDYNDHGASEILSQEHGAQDEEVGEEGKGEGDSPWNDAAENAFNVLKQEKLFSPPQSPAGMPAAPACSHYLSPSMSQIETQPQFDLEERVLSEGDCGEGVCETASESSEASEKGENDSQDDRSATESEFFDAGEEHPVGEEPAGEHQHELDPIDRLLQSVLSDHSAKTVCDSSPSAVSCESERGDSVDCESREEHQDEYLDPIERLLQSVLRTSDASSAAETDVGEAGAAEGEEEEHHKADEGDVCYESDSGEEEGLDPSSEPMGYSFDEAEGCTVASSQESESDSAVSDAQDDITEFYSVKDQEVEDEKHQEEKEEESEREEEAPARCSTPLLLSEDSSQVTECDNPADDATETRDLSFGDEADEAYSDEEDHFSFPVASENPAGEGRKSRGGGYLLNLCEMGSMKRTSSMPSNTLDNAAKAESDPLMEESFEDNEDHVAEQNNSQMQFSSPQAFSQEGTGVTAVTITTRKKEPVFSTYMEPDLFASPPWMSASVFSPEVVVQRGALRTPADETPSSEASQMPESEVFASGGTAVDSEASSTVNCAAGSPETTAFHDPLQDLVDQVRGLNIAAAASSTPMSKISFQTTAGQFSNMIVKAQSVNRLQRSFAQLSDSESDSENDAGDSAGSSPASHCAQSAQDQNTPAVDAIERMSCEENHENGQSPAEQVHGTPIAPPSGETLCSEEYSAPPSAEFSPRRESVGSVVSVPLIRAALFHSPKRRSSIWRRLSTGTVSSIISNETEETASAGEEEDEGRNEQENSLDGIQADLSPPHIATPALRAFDEVTVDSADEGSCQESPERSQTTQESEEVLGFDLFQDFVVPPLMMDPNCVTDSNNKVLRALGLSKFAFPVHRPHSSMSVDDLDSYNDLLQQGRESELIEKFHSAATFYERALELCDEDVALHGKLAWLLDVLSSC